MQVSSTICYLYSSLLNQAIHLICLNILCIKMFVRIMLYVLAVIAFHLKCDYIVSSILYYIFRVSTQNVISHFCGIKCQKSGIGVIGRGRWWVYTLSSSKFSLLYLLSLPSAINQQHVEIHQGPLAERTLFYYHIRANPDFIFVGNYKSWSCIIYAYCLVKCI